MSRRTIPLPFAVDLRRSLRPLRLGKHDPTFDLRVDAATLSMRTPAGPATLRAVREGTALEVEAWGPGTGWALEGAPALLGCLDERAGFDPRHPLLRRLHREGDGLRLPATARVHEALVRAVLSVGATGFEAKRAFRLLVEQWGEPAPGPAGLLLVPSPQAIGEIGYHDLHVIGVETKRADALQRACGHVARLERVAAATPEELRGALDAIAGVDRGTSAEVARVVLGDADAVSVGDLRLPHLVAWALASEPRGTDERMLELLEPYRPHRGRVCTLLESAGITAPRGGPRACTEPSAER